MVPQFLNQNNTTVFRSSGEGLLYYSFKDKIYPLDIIQGNLFKIREKDFNGRLFSQVPEFQFYEVRTQDGIRTFTFAPPPTKLIAGGGGNTKTIIQSGEGNTFEDGTFTLSADGSTATLSKNGGAFNPLVVTSLGGGQSADGSTATLSKNGGAFNPLVVTSLGGGQFRITIPTIKELKLGTFTTLRNDGTFNPTSYGTSDGVLQNFIPTASNELVTSITDCIGVQFSGNGWTGLITAINPTSFDITFTKVGAGLDITGQFHLIEEP